MAHRPDVVRRDGCHSVQYDPGFPGRIQAGDNTPMIAIPVLDQGLPDVKRGAAGMRREAHGPDVIRGDHRHPIELIPVCACAHIGTGNDFPGSIDNSRWAGRRGGKRRWRLGSRAD